MTRRRWLCQEWLVEREWYIHIQYGSDVQTFPNRPIATPSRLQRTRISAVGTEFSPKIGRNSRNVGSLHCIQFQGSVQYYYYYTTPSFVICSPLRSQASLAGFKRLTDITALVPLSRTISLTHRLSLKVTNIRTHHNIQKFPTRVKLAQTVQRTTLPCVHCAHLFQVITLRLYVICIIHL